MMGRVVSLVLGCCAIVSAAATPAQSYPARPVKVVVAFAAGSASDILARTIAQHLSVSLGQSFVVENRAGASGTIGTEFVAKSAPDGYTLLTSTIAQAITHSVYRGLRYDMARDMTSIMIVTHSPLVMAANPGFAPRTILDMIAFAKANPGKVNFGSTGTGTSTHLASEKLKLDAGFDMVHVPYKSVGSAYADLMGGQIQVMFDNILALTPHFKAGRLRPLAVSSARRHPLLPEVPSFAEAGVRDFEVVTWLGFSAPAGTPRDIVNRLNAEIAKILSIPEVRKSLTDGGADIVGGSPEAADRYIQAEIERWGMVVRSANIRAD